MTDQELIELLRRMSPRLDMLDCENVLTAADRIEELVGDQKQGGEDYCALMEKHDALHVKLTKAVDYSKQAISAWDKPHYGDEGTKIDNAFDGFELLRKALDELEVK